MTKRKNEIRYEKDYLILHINRELISKLFILIMWLFIIFFIVAMIIGGVIIINNWGYNNGYSEGQFKVINETISKFKEYGEVQMCLYEDCIYMNMKILVMINPIIVIGWQI